MYFLLLYEYLFAIKCRMFCFTFQQKGDNICGIYTPLIGKNPDKNTGVYHTD